MLDAIVKCQMKIVDYLDVTFNLDDDIYKLFKKQILKRNISTQTLITCNQFLKTFQNQQQQDYLHFLHQNKYFTKLDIITDNILQVANEKKKEKIFREYSSKPKIIKKLKRNIIFPIRQTVERLKQVLATFSSFIDKTFHQKVNFFTLIFLKILIFLCQN